MPEKTGTVRAGYSGKVKNNWAAVDEQALGFAKSEIFQGLCTNPEVAYVNIPPHSSNIRDHGQVWDFPGNGRYSLEVKPGSQHEHTDKDWKGHFKNWQGSRSYDYMLDLQETSK
ncbi:uncharacterized protein N7484_001264 [Penicillium longicatenatum]|uniref:uncharacterized protein n=1 Tax=Penicillium longicatenatum TaxID=1561947 RepID=UPI002548CFFD|nr:uncharacterized protein N7484_001264 [Penicillium longicatenatum]KAJ5657615.1 hypothetical protein N7484_001264 [Penicillium longicatenatum]